MNFKVNDTVKIVNAGHCFTTYADWFKKYCPDYEKRFIATSKSGKGVVGRIVAMHSHETIERYGMLYAVKSGESVYLISGEGLALVERSFTKDDLKTGMFVTTRNGRGFRLLLGTGNGDYGMDFQTGRYIKLKCYNDDLTDKNNREWDIVKVESVKYPENMKRKLLWERKPEITELTAEEAYKIIAEKKGVPVESLRVKWEG